MSGTVSEAFVIGRYKWLKNNGKVKQAGMPSRLPGSRSKQSGRSNRVSSLSGNVRGVQQIVFKQVRGGGCHGPNGLGAQMEYVLGKAEHIIDPNKLIDGQSHLPAEYSRALAESWAENWERKIQSGHSSHLVASFPLGTSPEAVADIIRATCFDLLDQGRSRFTYVAAVHDDKAHPHAHIIVDRRNAEGEFFYLARDHEFSYDVFKDKIVEHAATHGIELVNTSRLSRGLVEKPEPHERQKPALRGLAGELVQHGAAPYQHKPKARMNYFVTVKTEQGEKTLWGKELGGALADSGAEVGDQVRVKHEGKETVEIKTKDGQVITAHRNNWSVEVGSREAEIDGNTTKNTAGGTEPVKEPTEAEIRSVEWKHAQLLQHAQEYRDFAEVLKQGFPALSQGFLVAAHMLEQGRGLTANISDNLKDDLTMPNDNQMRTENEQLTQTIAQVRNDLMAVRDGIEAMPPSERPAIEGAYFDALRDMQTLTRGSPERELTDPANGTIYAAQAREEIQSMSRDDLSAALNGSAIDPDELLARLSIQSDNAALEAHWVEADAAAIADARGFDMDTQEGRDLAFKEVVETYQRIQDRGLDLGADDGDLPNAPNDTGVSQSIDNTTNAGIVAQVERGVLDQYDQPVNEYSKFEPLVIARGQAEAESSQSKNVELAHAFIALANDRNQGSMSVDDGRKADALLHDTAEKYGSDMRTALEQEDSREFKSHEHENYDAYSDEVARFDEQKLSEFNKAIQPYEVDNRELTTEVETRAALIAEAKELASHDTLTGEQQRRLVEIVDQTLGRQAAQELNAGNTEPLRDFGIRDDQLNIAEKYLEAQQASGADRTDALEAVSKDREIHEIDKSHEKSQALEQEDEAHRRRTREEGLER